MKIQLLVLVAIVSVLFFACQGSKETAFSEARPLNDLQNTRFVQTLESPLEKGKNTVYCSTLLFAWDMFRREMNGDVRVKAEDVDLFMLNASRSFERSLPADEFSSTVVHSQNQLIIKVSCHVLLPFIRPFAITNAPLLFNDSTIESFGSDGENNLVEMLYYKNDTDFVIKLRTKDTSHELILMNTDKTFETLFQAIQVADEKIKFGKKEKKGHDDKRYKLCSEDAVRIPEINFKLKTNYPTLENREVYASGVNWKTIAVNQLTAFNLDEKGAEVESVAEMRLGAMYDPNNKPKRLIFNKPFFVFVRKVGVANPYFALWVENAELLVKK